MRELKITVRKVPEKEDVRIVEFSGEIDTTNSSLILENIQPLLEEGITKIIGDFSEVRYINSTGIYALLRCYAWTKSKGGYLKLIGVRSEVLEVMETLGIPRVIPIHKTFQEILSSEGIV